ncbi:MAG: hypothetical protein U1A77_18860 [Pirellulales bacterium]
MNLFTQTVLDLLPLLRAGDLAVYESQAIAALRALPPSPFHIVAELAITSDPRHAAAHMEKFMLAQAAHFNPGAICVEMNGFDINTDRWYFDLLAYTRDGGIDNLGWLCDWQSERFPDYTITGLEKLQAVYASSAFRDREFRDARDVAGLVVVAKFQRFIRSVSKFMRSLQVPLYATAHEYDLIARIVREG